MVVASAAAANALDAVAAAVVVDVDDVAVVVADEEQKGIMRLRGGGCGETTRFQIVRHRRQ